MTHQLLIQGGAILKWIVVLLLGALAYPPPTQDQANPVTIGLVNPTHKAQCPSPCTRHAIIFVHGLWGSDATWTNPDTHKSWPQLLSEDRYFDDFDVYEADYPTSPAFWSPENKIRLTRLGEDLDEVLQQNIVSKYKTIHLVGHSMGGNVILTSLLSLKFRYPNAHQILTKYKNIILLGTPVEGADLANFGLLVSQDEALIGLKPVVENELPVLIELAMHNIDEKRQVLGLPSLRVSAGYEKDRYLGTIIVSQRSATAVADSRFPDTMRGFDRNHVTLVKPKDQNDEVYVWVRGQIQDALSSP